MKLLATALVGIMFSTSAVSGMLSGNSGYRSSLEGDSLVKFELARVVCRIGTKCWFTYWQTSKQYDSKMHPIYRQRI